MLAFPCYFYVHVTAGLAPSVDCKESQFYNHHDTLKKIQDHQQNFLEKNASECCCTILFIYFKI